MNRQLQRLLVAALAIIPLAISAQAAETIKIAYTDPLSGPFAQVGGQNLAQMQYIIVLH